MEHRHRSEGPCCRLLSTETSCAPRASLESAATMGATRERNVVFHPDSKAQWLQMFA